MQEATKALPVQQLDTPSSDLGLKIGVGGRAYGKLDSRATQKEKQESATKAPAASKEPQKPPVNAPPPPIYGREAATAAQSQQTQPASQQPASTQPQPPPVPGQSQPAPP
jgi:hypothetical protein